MGSNRIVVLTAMPLEAAAVRAHLPQRVRRDLPVGTIVEEAELPGTGYSVCLVCTGPGNGHAAVVAERVIGWADPAAVLFVGVAGGLKDDLALGDVVVATRVVSYQGGKETATGFKTRPESWDGAHRLLQVAQYIEANASWVRLLPNDNACPAPNVHFKPVASGEVVKDAGDSPLATLLDTTYNDAVAIEMEAAGVARAAQHSAVDLLVIRGISDRSDGTKASSDDDGWQLRAARNAAAFALGVIAALPAPGPTGGSAPAHWQGLSRATALFGFYERPSQIDKARIISLAETSMVDLGTALRTCSNYLLTTERPAYYRDAIIDFLNRGGTYSCYLMDPECEETRYVEQRTKEPLREKIENSLAKFGQFKANHKTRGENLHVYLMPFYPSMAALAADLGSDEGMLLYSPYVSLPYDVRVYEKSDMPHYFVSASANLQLYSSLSEVLSVMMSDHRVARVM